ncbi:dipeptidase [Naumannella halotolerans]|uniref:dipeptidase n=1 Tax=Naumannella halotolerans TaxID=993414 RepID=UPI00370D9163
MSELEAAVEREIPGVIADLERLVAIPSVSADPAHDADVQRCAEEVAALLQAAGCPEVEIVSEGGKPAVIGRCPAPEGTPTVCLYAHYDVQPTGGEQGWQTAPFTATERDGRLYGRGAADDKGGLAVHLATLRAFGGKPPVGITFFIEGEEEVGSPSLGTILARHADKLACDLFVITDSSNWEVGVPAFTTSLRGLAECYVTVQTLGDPVHSGQFGGVAPDALTALCKLLGTLHDDRGDVAVAGLHRGTGPELDYTEERFRAESGVLEGVGLIGTGSISERLWYAPSVSVVGLDARPVEQASNTLYPSARAKVSLRVAPGGDGAAEQAALAEHLRTHAPWGVQVSVTEGESGPPARLSLDGALAEAAKAAFTEAFGVEPVPMGMGGSIPMAQEFADAVPGATVLVTAVCDPGSQIHGFNESLDLGDFAKACKAEALLLRKLAGA